MEENPTNQHQGPHSQSEPSNGFNIENRTEDSSYYTLQKMNQVHLEIVRRIVAGHKDHEIASSLGISKAMVKYTKESPIVKRKLEVLQGERDASAIEVRNHIENLAPLALHELQKMMAEESTSDRTRMKIAQDVLDRAGFKPANVNVNASTKLDKDDISAAKERAKKNGLIQENEDVQDAEIIEEQSNGTGKDKGQKEEASNGNRTNPPNSQS